MVTTFKGLGSSCDVMLVAKVCLRSVTPNQSINQSINQNCRYGGFKREKIQKWIACLKFQATMRKSKATKMKMWRSNNNSNNNNNNNNNTLLFLQRTLQNCPNALYTIQKSLYPINANYVIKYVEAYSQVTLYQVELAQFSYSPPYQLYQIDLILQTTF